MINYGHRGAADYAPENTMASFYMGLQKGADGLETDIQRTKDGVLVLFHDDNLQRILKKDGAISDFTFEELAGLDFGAHFSEQYAGERIVRLKDFLYYFYNRPIHLALEIKQQGIEEDFVKMLESFGHRENCVITSFNLESLIAVRKLMPKAPLGHLVREVNADVYANLDKYNIRELCPKADIITPALVTEANLKGFSVRAWGVKTKALMEQCVNANVAGMTINSPDMLVNCLKG